jgi:transketolase
MAAIANSLSLSKHRAFGAAFFIFSDYARPAIRLSAIMELPTIFVFTHDAMDDGEDGTTHQPGRATHLSARGVGLVMLRPADANEVSEAIATSCSCAISRQRSRSRALPVALPPRADVRDRHHRRSAPTMC